MKKREEGKRGRLRMSNRKFRTLLIIPIALVCIFAIIATAASQIMSSTLDTYLGSGTTSIQKADDTKDWDADYYDADGIDAEETKDDAYKVAAQVQDEGTVLLKNDGSLPLAKGSVVMPFGDAYLNPVYGQNASGGSAKWVKDPVTPEEGLSAFTIDNSAVDAMKAAGEPEALEEAPGTLAAGKAGSALGGDCLDMEHRVATTLLAGNKHLYQNYYFELSRFNDPLTHIAKYSEEMFLRGRYIEGIQNITSVMKCLNYFKVVAVSNQSLYEPIERASRSIKLIEDDVTAADYQKRLVMLEMELLIQKDLYTTLDFSGYRMYDEGLLALALPVCEYDGGFSDYYRSLEESERLSARQKLRLKANLLDDLSEIMIFDPLARRDVEIDYVNSLRKNYSYLKRKFANSFLAMKPIALMLLSAMDNKDDACVRMYALRGFDERLFEALWILCVMGLIKHLLCGSERLFIGEMTINDQEARKYLAAVPFDRLVGKTELLKELHAELLACYDIGPASDKRCELAFGYDVRLSFDEKSAPVIESVFKALLGDSYANFEGTKSLEGSCIRPDEKALKLLQEAMGDQAADGE
ncbi:hypothetical protein ACTNC1_12165 [Atopobiaceae bacterium HCP3S3_A4]